MCQSRPFVLSPEMREKIQSAVCELPGATAETEQAFAAMKSWALDDLSDSAGGNKNGKKAPGSAV